MTTYHLLIILPALVSLLIKSSLVFISRYSIKQNYFTALLFICFFQSLCEVVTFFLYFSGHEVGFLFRLYYVVLIFWITFSLLYILEFKKINAAYGYAALAIATVLSGVIFSTDFIVSGYYWIGYSITAVREQFYWSYQIFVFASIILTIGLLIHSVKKSTLQNKTQSKYLLAAYSIPYSVILTVSVLMALGFKINMLMILPISTAISLAFIVLSEENHQLVDLRRLLFWSPESKSSRKLNIIFRQLDKGEISLFDAEKAFQRVCIEHQKRKTRSNSARAKALGIARSTLHDKAERLDINLKE